MNISKVMTQYHSEEGEDVESEEYEYDEVYFRADGITREDIENDIDGYYSSGAEWTVDVPLTKEARIKALEQSLAQAQADLEAAKSENDIAIAELSICIASVLAE